MNIHLYTVEYLFVFFMFSFSRCVSVYNRNNITVHVNSAEVDPGLQNFSMINLQSISTNVSTHLSRIAKMARVFSIYFCDAFSCVVSPCQTRLRT